MQYVRRIDVEGGFLDGVSIEFSDALNVVIGARGTGKTSLIELLRYALRSRNHTPESDLRSREHAEAILQDGNATVYVQDDDNVYVQSRSLSDQQELEATNFEPLVFSQLEIETLALTEAGRLRLIDSFVPIVPVFKRREAELAASLRSLSKEILSIDREVNSIEQELVRLPLLNAEALKLTQSAEAFNSKSHEIERHQATLKSISEEASLIGVKDDFISRFQHQLDNLKSKIDATLIDEMGLEPWSGKRTDDPLADVRSAYQRITEDIKRSTVALRDVRKKTDQMREPLRRARLEKELQARGLRTTIEKLAEGSGTIARQLGQVKNQIAHLEGRQGLVTLRRERLHLLRAKRASILMSISNTRRERFAARAEAAAELSAALGPQISVRVNPLGELTQYTQVLSSLLRGSGLRYNELASSLSQLVSPLELLTYVESQDVVSLVETTGLSRERVTRMLAYMSEIDLSPLAGVTIEDQADLLLLDGIDYKKIQNLSAGQRCTVVLAIVLHNNTRALIIDQPEDHLDNAYIANTIVRELRKRKGKAQVIVATHNANIPVLGEAEIVIEMVSDGRHGYVQTCESLDGTKAVNAITRVMEGGLEAFQRRANFYRDHKAL